MSQKFIGIRSGLTGETVIMFPGYTLVPGSARTAGSVGAVLELRLEHPWQDLTVPGEVLGHIRYEGRFSHTAVAVLESGVEVPVGESFHYLVDAAMAILQYLSDHGAGGPGDGAGTGDSRLYLREYAEIMREGVVAGSHRNSRRRPIGQ